MSAAFLRPELSFDLEKQQKQLHHNEILGRQARPLPFQCTGWNRPLRKDLHRRDLLQRRAQGEVKEGGRELLQGAFQGPILLRDGL